MCLHFRRYMDSDPDSDYYEEPAYECKYDDGVSPEDEVAGCPHFKSDYTHEEQPTP